MGGCCVQCGSTTRLQFHHKKKRTWEARKTARWVRLARYYREWQDQIVELLCKKCNQAAGAPVEDEEPWV